MVRVHAASGLFFGHLHSKLKDEIHHVYYETRRNVPRLINIHVLGLRQMEGDNLSTSTGQGACIKYLLPVSVGYTRDKTCALSDV